MGQHVPVKWSTLTFPMFSFPRLPLTRSSFPPSLCLKVQSSMLMLTQLVLFCFVLFISTTLWRICIWTAEGVDHILLLNFCSYTHLLYLAFMTSIKVLNSYLMKVRLSRHLPIGFYGSIHSGTMKIAKVNNSRRCHQRWWAFNDGEPFSHLSRAPEIKETTNRELKCWRN